MIAKLAGFSVGSLAPLLAQATWVVNAGGGPGVNFLDLPTAVASANVVDGDTILVQTGPFGEGATGFTTSKGLTIVGVGGFVPIGTGPGPGQRVEVVGLPAGRDFRMVGFDQHVKDALFVRLQNCAGTVHLEAMRTHEYGFFFPTLPAIEIQNCASVTMRAVDDFGMPAVACTGSRLTLVSCRLGVTDIALGGGPALHATSSVVDIVQPNFDPAGWWANSIVSTNSSLRIAGDSTSLLAGGSGAAITTVGGIVLVDPTVPMPMTAPGPAITGTAAITFLSMPASWTTAGVVAGQPLTIRSTAAAGAFLFQALGAPGPLTTSPLGDLGIDPLQPYVFFPPLVVPAGGVVNNTAAVPATLPRGLAFASQSVVLSPASLVLGAPVTFVLY